MVGTVVGKRKREERGGEGRDSVGRFYYIVAVIDIVLGIIVMSLIGNHRHSEHRNILTIFQLRWLFSAYAVF